MIVLSIVLIVFKNNNGIFIIDIIIFKIILIIMYIEENVIFLVFNYNIF